MEQDEMFDTFFLEQVASNDAVGQDIVDPGLDAIMVVDGVARVKPEIFVPEDQIMSVLKESFSVDVDTALLAEAARRVKLAVIDHFGPIAQQYASTHREDLSWASAHYLDETIIGSLGSETEPTGAYGAAVWSRLNGDILTSDIVSSFGGHSLLSQNPDEKRVYGLVLSRAVRVGSIQGGIAARVTGSDELEYLAVRPGVWTQSDDQYTRVIRLEVSASTDLDAYQFSAPTAWEWIDNEPSVGGWYNMIKDPQTSPVLLNDVEAASNDGCMTYARTRAPLLNLYGFLLLFSLSMRRLKA